MVFFFTSLCIGDEIPQLCDIENYTEKSRDDVKSNLITNREPEISFIFPARQYKDKRSKSRHLNRFCYREWFKKFEFLCYSKASDGLYCLACVLFPDSSHWCPK